jgi:hypothetical protein
MKKKLVLFMLICVLVSQVFAQTSKIDTVAVSILDRMSAVIGDLASCSVKISSSYDVHTKHLGLIKHSDEEKLYMHGPDKLLAISEGDKGSRSFYFNGSVLTYYSVDKNQYAQINAPSSIMTMIDSVHKNYGIDFPLSDFFYPTFVDDLIAESKELVFLGTTKVNGKECFHIAGIAKDKSFQFWISDDAYSLPLKEVIVFTAKDGNPQFEADFSDWQINPVIPNAVFEFNAAPQAKKINLAAVHIIPVKK